MRRVRSHQRFLFVGNHPCLDFINTQMIVRGRLTDLLGGFDQLSAWLVQAKIVNRTQVTLAERRWTKREKAQVLGKGLLLRKTLRAIAERIVARRTITNSSLATINQLLSQSYLRLVYANGRFERRFQSYGKEQDRLLIPLAEAASDLLCSGERSLVKKCGNAACILYFYDTTKNHTRTWCSMRLCGNRTKVAAHYQRKRKNSQRWRVQT
jgi:predicted RNA-binding Zn ribbon-like protein